MKPESLRSLSLVFLASLLFSVSGCQNGKSTPALSASSSSSSSSLTSAADSTSVIGPVGTLTDTGFDLSSFPTEYVQYDLVDTSMIKVKKTDEKGNVFTYPLDSDSVSGLDNITSKVGIQSFTLSYHDLTEKVPITVYYADDEYNEPYRSQFHYSKKKGWINDPNGLVYNSVTGEYHMYYQDGPRMGSDPNNYWSKRSWGHAVSKDLMHWREVGIAIAPENDGFGDIWSGCSVVDLKNTSGLFSASSVPEERLVALYSVTRPQQQYCLAFSEDGGYTWTKYAGNPIINNSTAQYGGGFRDCKCYWMEESQCWLMVTAGESGMRIFTSTNLTSWKLDSQIRDKDGNTVGKECPMLCGLPVDGDASKMKYVLSDGGTYYYLGSLAKDASGNYVYTIESDKQVFNAGQKNYATQDWTILNSSRTVMTSWISDYYMATDASLTPDRPWEGLMGLPVSASLKTMSDGSVMLCTEPVEELNSLKGAEIFSAEDFLLDKNADNILESVHDTTFEIDTSVYVGSAPKEDSEFGFEVRKGSAQSAIISYKPSTRTLTVDQTNNLVANYKDECILSPLPDDTLKLKIVVDRGAVEVYANQGEKSITTLNFLPDASDSMVFYQKNMECYFDTLSITHLKSILHKES
jgi:fructan beta-fructosidase